MEGYRYEMMDEKSAKPYLDVSPPHCLERAESRDYSKSSTGVVSRYKTGSVSEFTQVSGGFETDCQVHCSYLQIYQEKIYDLLNTF